MTSGTSLEQTSIGWKKVKNCHILPIPIAYRILVIKWIDSGNLSNALRTHNNQSAYVLGKTFWLNYNYWTQTLIYSSKENIPEYKIVDH